MPYSGRTQTICYLSGGRCNASLAAVKKEFQSMQPDAGRHFMSLCCAVIGMHRSAVEHLEKFDFFESKLLVSVGGIGGLT